MAGGRPTKYDPTAHPRVAESMCKLGATENEVAEALGIHIATLQRWKSSHEEFCAALKTGKGPSDDRVQASLYKRAVGYSYESVKIFQFQGKEVIVPYTEHVQPDTTAAIFWLKNRRPAEWRQNPDAEQEDSGAQPVNVNINVSDARTRD